MSNDQQYRIMQLREAGHVQRCHTLPHYGSYDVAQHSWHMLILLDQLHPNPSMNLVRAVMLHDVHERWAGDSPFMAKKLIPSLKKSLNEAEKKIEERVGFSMPELTEEETVWLKALDNIEFFLWALDQAAMGSRIGAQKAQESWNNMPKLPIQCRRFLDLFLHEEASKDLTVWKWIRTYDTDVD